MAKSISHQAAPSGTSVPILLDDIKRGLPGFAMTRFYFLTIESIEESADWRLQTSFLPAFGIVLFDLTGVITGPVNGQPSFDDPDAIDQTYEVIEQGNMLSVESGSLWMPNEIVVAERNEAAVNDVFRIDWETFLLARQFAAERISQHEFEQSCKAAAGQRNVLDYSADETDAFRNWRERQIAEAQQNYSQQTERLRWTDAHGNTYPG